MEKAGKASLRYWHFVASWNSAFVCQPSVLVMWAEVLLSVLFLSAVCCQTPNMCSSTADGYYCNANGINAQMDLSL